AHFDYRFFDEQHPRSKRSVRGGHGLTHPQSDGRDQRAGDLGDIALEILKGYRKRSNRIQHLLKSWLTGSYDRGLDARSELASHEGLLQLLRRQRTDGSLDVGARSAFEERDTLQSGCVRRPQLRAQALRLRDDVAKVARELE